MNGLYVPHTALVDARPALTVHEDIMNFEIHIEAQKDKKISATTTIVFDTNH